MAANDGFVDIDGSMLEGGGQILRNCIALSALLSRPVRITRIRAGREKPGLKAQHCSSIDLVRRLCSASCVGCTRDSQEVAFRPGVGGITGGEFPREDIGTAGSVSLIVQAALPVLAFARAPSVVRIRGGTNVDFAPPAEHMSDTLGPLVGAAFGLEFRLRLMRRGFYPKGGGEAALEVQPLPPGGCLKPARLLDQGRLLRFSGVAYACGALPARVAGEMATAARQRLSAAYPDAAVDVATDTATPAFGNGCGLALTAHTSTGCALGASALGKRGVPAAEVAAVAVDRLLADLRRGACLDEHTQDQLVLLMALADGESAVRVGSPLTLHTRTAIHVAQLLTGVQFSVSDEEGRQLGDGDVSGDGSACCVLSCRGIGLKMAA